MVSDLAGEGNVLDLFGGGDTVKMSPKVGGKGVSLIGERFGRWVVISEVRGRGGHCLCLCDCGKEVKVFRGSLVTGASQSCGCARHHDLLGRKFDCLTPIRPIKIILSNGKPTAGFTCECTCGRIKDVLQCDLERGRVKSCGFHRQPVKTRTYIRIGTIRIRHPFQPGMVFGRLVVQEEIIGLQFRSVRCMCSCGKETVVHAAALKAGATQSCGCLHVEVLQRGLAPGESALHSLFLRCQSNALIRGREFTLTLSEAKVIFDSPCHYCGVPPSMIKRPPTPLRNHREGMNYAYNGLERVDNALGYTRSNVVPACWPCNRSKSSMSADEFLTWALRIHSPVFDMPVLSKIPTGYLQTWHRYQKDAPERGLAFELEYKDAVAMFAAPCSYCGVLPCKGYTGRGKYHTGIDRINNAVGYLLSNCTPACWTCNRAKGKFTQEAFLTWATRLQAFQQVSTSIR